MHRTTFVAVLCILAAATGSAAAQDFPEPRIGLSDPSSARVITSFAGIQWGAAEGEIISLRGRPTTERPAGAGAKGMVYEDEQIIGRESAAEFVVHPEQGLIRGMYFVAFGRGRDCETAFDRLVSDISARYPTIEPTVRKSNESSLDLCGGVSIGRADAWAHWAEPVPKGLLSELTSDRGSIMVLLPPEDKVISVYYDSPAADAWSDEAAKERREAVF
ncbi:MAG: hypothetical protein GEU90_00605 [Gemmatimonas sp.]|nr:hypothetical protein [Gemmatimonas sp.]